jgi:ATP-dependent helicase/nuclease subunit A
MPDSDAAAREQALDVRRSFLVQAPAGSGKTGLLIQRYLALLAHVDRPERIVAMTFTLKAAAEMRERVVQALRDAADNRAFDEGRTHEAVTRRLALAALAQDSKCDWQLLAQPSRLRILTIDALAASLARQAPVATGLGALPQFVEDASDLYVRAVREALAAAGPNGPAWRTFLARLDNDANRATDLLASLLARRDQWLRLPVGAGGAVLRDNLEQALRAEIDAALAHTHALFPPGFAARVVRSARDAARQFGGTPGKEEAAAALVLLAERGGVPPASTDEIALWRTLSEFLLTGSEFRRQVDVRHGFPPSDKGPGAAERAVAKQAMTALLDDARAIPGLAESLHTVKSLPKAAYDEAAWAFVEAALAILPKIAGHLLTVFAAEGAADFNEATLRALAALGNADDPGELLLAVDYRLSHLLVDEFQDTSWTHRELIGRLTAGWQEGDGRTLFAVGDPMQSIYRFREAEVGIFLGAQQDALVAGIPVTSLDLADNFRSQAAIVSWVNSVFVRVLPPISDPERGEVAYKRVQATRTGNDPGPTIDIVADRAAEAVAVLRRIRDAQAAGSEDIAVLVHARSHLDLLLPALRSERIDYTAVKVETLAQRLATRDLLSLTRALTQPADRLAALSLLRAPWCGLQLADLLLVAEDSRQGTVLETVADDAVVERMTADGGARTARLRNALREAHRQRGRMALAPRVRAAWLALGGPASGDGALDAAGAEKFFALLARHERAGDVPAWDTFAAAAARLFAEGDPSGAAGVQVMTVHEAKGLEFDTVILPGLDRATGRGDEPALRWKQRERHGAQQLLLAPLHAREGVLSEPDPVYRYLRILSAAEDRAERGRLLYVACTRAKQRLHLMGVLGTKPGKGGGPAQWRAPAGATSLAQLWPAVQGDVAPPAALAAVAEPEDDEGADDATPLALPLRRLSLQWQLPEFAPPIPGTVSSEDSEAQNIAFDWAHATAAAIGTVAHRLLAQVANSDLLAWTDDPTRIVNERSRIVAELATEGVPPAERSEAADRIEAAIARTLSDPRGRWLFDPAHADAYSEWALAGVDQGGLRHVTIDRTFVADGVRWIVDFKTGSHEGGATDAFLDREEGRYSAQLERYARIVSAIDPRPIRLALYYPLVEGGWREWPFAGAQ